MGTYPCVHVVLLLASLTAVQSNSLGSHADVDTSLVQAQHVSPSHVHSHKNIVVRVGGHARASNGAGGRAFDSVQSVGDDVTSGGVFSARSLGDAADLIAALLERVSAEVRKYFPVCSDSA